MRKAVRFLLLAFLCLLLGGCSESQPPASEPQLLLGFSQLGSESSWRIGNTRDIEAKAAEYGISLMMENANQKQENQIAALRRFIAYRVDVIAFSPIVEEGWDNVLKEAKEAGIPVIIVDRMVEADEDLYTAWVGSDFVLEGRLACEWLHWFTSKRGIDPSSLHIVDIQGTIGSSAQIGRSNAVAEASAEYGWDLAAVVQGEYAQTKSREVMEDLLRRNSEINVVYCENDNEAYGALEALENAGKKAGIHPEQGEVLVISFDATTRGLSCVLDGRIAVDAECNPLHGPRVREIIEMLEEGRDVPKKTYVSEDVFSCTDAVLILNAQDGSHDVIAVTQELIDSRAY